MGGAQQADVVVVGLGVGGEQVAGAMSVAVYAEVPIAKLLDTVWAYPTFHRGFSDALGSLR